MVGLGSEIFGFCAWIDVEANTDYGKNTASSREARPRAVEEARLWPFHQPKYSHSNKEVSNLLCLAYQDNQPAVNSQCRM